jgi:hypothetical protein
MEQVTERMSAALTARGIDHVRNKHVGSHVIQILVQGKFCHVCVIVDRARLMKSVEREAIAPRSGDYHPEPGASRASSNQFTRMGAIAGLLATPSFFIRYNPDPWRMHKKGIPSHHDVYEKEHNDAPFDARMDRLAASIRAFCALDERQVREKTRPPNVGFTSGGLMHWELMYFTDDKNGTPQPRSLGGRPKKRKEPEPASSGPAPSPAAPVANAAPTPSPVAPSDPTITGHFPRGKTATLVSPAAPGRPEVCNVGGFECFTSLNCPPTSGVKGVFLKHPIGSKLPGWDMLPLYYATEFCEKKVDAEAHICLSYAIGKRDNTARDIYDHAIFVTYGGRPWWTDEDRARVEAFDKKLKEQGSA